MQPVSRVGGIDRRRDWTASIGKLDPGPAQNINMYQLSLEELAAKGIKLLPQSLNEAIDALEGGRGDSQADWAPTLPVSSSA